MTLAVAAKLKAVVMTSSPGQYRELIRQDGAQQFLRKQRQPFAHDIARRSAAQKSRRALLVQADPMLELEEEQFPPQFPKEDVRWKS